MSQQTNKFVKFLRNNAAILLIAFCAIAILTIVLATSLSGEKAVPVANDQKPQQTDATTQPSVQPSEPVDNTPKTEIVKTYFQSPVAYTSLGMDYTDGEHSLFVFNSTLNRYETHDGIDLLAADGAQVSAMFDGVVTAVSDTYGMGNFVTVDHGNGVVATYASLGSVSVAVGQHVAKGDKLGTTGASASYEFLDGSHLHVEVKKSGKTVDPTPYVQGEIYVETEKTI